MAEDVPATAPPDPDARGIAGESGASDTPQPGGGPPRRPRRWLRRLALLVAVLAVAHALIGFLVVPRVVTALVVPAISDRLNGSLSVDRMAVNPYTLHVTLEGIRVNDSSDRPRIEVDRIDLNADLWMTLVGEGYHLRLLTVDNPRVSAELSEEGRLDLVTILEPLLSKDEPAEPIKTIPRVVIDRGEVRSASLRFRDAFVPAEPFDVAVTGASLNFDHIDTQPGHDNRMRLEARFGSDEGSNETAVWEGQVRVDPLTSEGKLIVTGLQLQRFMPYGLRFTDARLTGGRLSLELNYRFAPVASPRLAEVELTSLSLEQPEVVFDESPWLAAETLRVREARLDADARSVDVAEATVEAPRIEALRDEQGRLRVVRIIDDVTQRIQRFREARAASRQADASANRQPAAAASSDDPEPGPPTPPRVDPTTLESPVDQISVAVRQLIRDALAPWRVRLGSLSVREGSGVATDRAVQPALDLAFSSLSLDAGPIESEAAYAVPFRAELKVQDTGRLAANGRVEPLAVRAQAELNASGMRASWLKPYLQIPLAGNGGEVRVAEAVVDLAGAAQGAWVDGAPQGSFTGDIDLSQIDASAQLPIKGRLMPAAARVPAIRVAGLEASLEPLSASVENLRIDSPELNLTVPILPLPGDPPTPLAAAAPPGDEADPHPARILNEVPLKLDQLEVHNASVSLTGANAADPPLVINVSAADFNLQELDTRGSGPASFDLVCAVANTGRVEARGTLTPPLFPPSARADIEVTGVPTPPFDALLRYYLGHAAQRGEVNADWSVTLQQGQLDGILALRMEDFYLGQATPSPAAPPVPVKLGLQLLRDVDGAVTTRVPIRGDVTGPGFRLDELIIENIVSELIQAASSPLKVVGMLMGRNQAEELSRIGFEPGGTAIAAGDLEKLRTVAELLAGSPRLSLTVYAVPTPRADAPTLRRQRLAEAMPEAVRNAWNPDADDQPEAVRNWVAQRYAATGDVAVPKPAPETLADPIDREAVIPPDPDQPPANNDSADAQAPTQAPTQATPDERTATESTQEPTAEPVVAPAQDQTYHRARATPDDQAEAAIPVPLVQADLIRGPRDRAQDHEADTRTDAEAGQHANIPGETTNGDATEAGSDRKPPQAPDQAPGTAAPPPTAAPDEPTTNEADADTPEREPGPAPSPGTADTGLPSTAEMIRALLDRISVEPEAYAGLARERAQAVARAIRDTQGIDPGQVNIDLAEPDRQAGEPVVRLSAE